MKVFKGARRPSGTSETVINDNNDNSKGRRTSTDALMMKGLLTRQMSTKQQMSPKVAALRAVVDKLLRADTGTANSFAFLRAYQEVLAVLQSHDYNWEEGWEGGLMEASIVAMENPVFSQIAWGFARSYASTEDYNVAMFNTPNFTNHLTREIIARNIDALWTARSLANVQELVEPIAKLSGVVPAMVQFILDAPKSEHALASLHTTFNLTNFPQGHPALLADKRTVDALLIMMEEDPERSLVSTMALANLVGKDEVKSELLRNVKGTPLLNIVAVLQAHLTTPNRTASAFETSWALFEPLQPLRWLSIPPKNRAMLGPKLFPLLPGALAKALKLDDVSSARCTVIILSHFAFDAEYLTKLKEDSALIAMLESIEERKKKQPQGSDVWSGCAHDAQGLLWTLRGGDQLEMTEDSQIKSNQVMISYNWAHKAVAIRVHSFFTSLGFTVWRDDDKIKENFMESMAQAVLESAAIVVLVSPQYKESANCQREALFASKHKKKMIPLLVQEGYSGDGWLELLIAPLMQYDITKDGFERMMRTMIDRELGDPAHRHQASSSSSSPRAAANHPSSSSSKHQQQQRQQAKHEFMSADKVANFLKTRPGLDSSISDAFLKEHMDGEAL